MARQTDPSARPALLSMHGRPTWRFHTFEQCVGLAYRPTTDRQLSAPDRANRQARRPFAGLCPRVALTFSPRSVRDLCPPRRTAPRAVQAVAPDCGDSSSACFLARAASSTAYSASSIAAYAYSTANEASSSAISAYRCALSASCSARLESMSSRTFATCQFHEHCESYRTRRRAFPCLRPRTGAASQPGPELMRALSQRPARGPPRPSPVRPRPDPQLPSPWPPTSSAGPMQACQPPSRVTVAATVLGT